MRMKFRALRTAAAIGVGVLVMGTVATACGQSDQNNGGESSSGTEKITLTVGNYPTADQKAGRAAFDKNVKEFEAANPNITLKPSELYYDPQTFQTLLAGGNVPDVIQVPFTEPQALIKRKQIADLTDVLDQTGVKDKLNPDSLNFVKDASGNIYGVPVFAYAVSLNYNRALFTKAGLDPDNPPSTWEEVRAAAKTITEKTGAIGYAQMSNKNCGGWMFSAMSYAFGGEMENQDGTAAIFASNGGSQKALELLHQMKFDDKSMGTQVLYDCESIVQAAASGKIGMYLRAPDVYTSSVVQYGMNSADFGITGMPIFSADLGRRAFTGGAVSVVKPTATEAEKEAAVKWIAYSSLRQFTDESQAVAQAKASKADGLPVALPGYAPVSSAVYDQYLEWVKPYNNVPIENFAPYVAALKDQTVGVEPAAQTQKLYGDLDPVVQKVLSDENADIPALLQSAETQVTAQLADR